MLIVDDEALVQDLVSRWLCDAGYQCSSASNAGEGWAHLQNHVVDLVTVDVRMPGISGLDFLDQINQTYPATAVLMLTAEGDASKAIRALTHGAFGYLTKPFERDELLAQVRNGLERRHLVLENRDQMLRLEQRVREQTHAIRAAHEETIYRLIKASGYRDAETGHHIRRTGWYSELLGAAAGWSPERVDLLRLAAPIHDIGKIAIPDSILRKPGRLKPTEIAIMQTHTLLGAKMLADSTSAVLRMAHDIALCHHEHWDGRGYPAGIAGSDIPESARIVAIVDQYDALTHDRVYRRALRESDALRMMHEARGTHFDPHLLDLFMSVLPDVRAVAAANPDSADAEHIPRYEPDDYTAALLEAAR